MVENKEKVEQLQRIFNFHGRLTKGETISLLSLARELVEAYEEREKVAAKSFLTQVDMRKEAERERDAYQATLEQIAEMRDGPRGHQPKTAGALARERLRKAEGE